MGAGSFSMRASTLYILWWPAQQWMFGERENSIALFNVRLFVSIFRVDRSISAQTIHARKDVSAATMVMISRATVPKDETVPIAVKCHER